MNGCAINYVVNHCIRNKPTKNNETAKKVPVIEKLWSVKTGHTTALLMWKVVGEGDEFSEIVEFKLEIEELNNIDVKYLGLYINLF